MSSSVLLFLVARLSFAIEFFWEITTKIAPYILAWDPGVWETSSDLKDSIGSEKITNEHLEYTGQLNSTCDTALAQSDKK